MISRKPGVLILLLVTLLLLTACDGGDGIRDSCQHLSSTPETTAMER
ncbi:MAG: hypothetical protein IPM39_09490 [Chloroflexi bacterium]|nr:hypothetical protein [Chloroflexota bacterium]